MSTPRALLAIAVVTLVTGATPAARGAEFGLSDGRIAMFDAPAFRGTDFRRVRLVVPWDAGLRDGPWNAWLTRAAAEHLPVLLAPGIDSSRCGPGECAGPSATSYRASLETLLTRYPVIDAVQGWNEPNHAIQPTAQAPALAARYFDVVHEACTDRCLAVAGNLLDVPSMPSYLATYRDALQSVPDAWGLQDYYDATYFGDAGLRTMLAQTSGPIWLTETGGLVSFRPPSGPGLPASESRAADSLRWIFTMATRTSRIARVYLYGLWQEPANPFDSALLRADGTERPSMEVARAYIGTRSAAERGVPLGDVAPARSAAGLGPAPGGSTGGSPPTAATPASGGGLRIDGKFIRTSRGRSVDVAVRCLAATACRGRLVVRYGSWTTARVVHVDAGVRRVVRFRPPAARGRRVPRPAWVCVTAADAGRCDGRIAIRAHRAA